MNLDILPTLCDVLNLPLPENKLDGKSILPIIQSNTAKAKRDVMHWMWQHMWAVKKGNWKLIYRGYDTTGKFSNHPENQFEMPEYYLANLNDENPEEINHAKQHPEILNELKKLHDTWAIDVFKDSSYDIPKFDNSDTSGNPKKGSKKL